MAKISKEDTLIHKLAIKHGLTLETVREIVFSQFKVARKHISDGNEDPVIFPYIGKLVRRRGKNAKGKTTAAGE